MAQPEDAWPADRPGRFRRTVLHLAPDGWHAVVAAEWSGALVLLRRGDIEVHARGGPFRFREGAVLWLDGLGPAALHNPGPSPATLVGISRARPP